MSELKISFYSKSKTICPVCDHSFNVEVVRTGRGRFNSSGIELDFRRKYVPTKKYGIIYPLIYNVIVCPACWFSALPQDFSEANKYEIKTLKSNEILRKKSVLKMIDNPIDFNENRNLELGLASFFLAIFCYNYYLVESVASFRKFLCALRAAWCSDDFQKENEDKKYSRITLYFRRLAFDCLNIHMQFMYHTKEHYTEVDYYGPDLDHDYGYDGFIYLSCYLGFLFSDQNHTSKERYGLLIEYRNRLSKVFGLGKPDKGSPSPLKNNVYAVYEIIKNTIEAMEKDDFFLIEEKKKSSKSKSVKKTASSEKLISPASDKTSKK